MRARGARNLKMIKNSSHVMEAHVRWILFQALTDVELMFCRIFVDQIRDDNLHSHVTVGLPPPSTKVLEAKRIKSGYSVPSSILSKPYSGGSTPSNLRHGLISIVQKIPWVNLIKMVGIVTGILLFLDGGLNR